MEHDIVKHNWLWRASWIAENQAIVKGTANAWKCSWAALNDSADSKVEQSIGGDKELNDWELKIIIAELRYS